MLADRILFIDAEAIVLDKPAGLAVDPPRDGSLSLENHRESLRFGYQRWPNAVHRLDRDTSGCLLLARNPKAQKRYSIAFEEGIVAKTYLAVTQGVPDGTEGRIDLPLAKVSSREAGWRMVGRANGKPAATRWTLLATDGGRALLRLEPETGRTHQLRVHVAEALGVPIVGDLVYGRAAPEGMLLHAWKLVMPRGTKPAIDAEAPVPTRFGPLADAAA